jgi:hypothetical protein
MLSAVTSPRVRVIIALLAASAAVAACSSTTAGAGDSSLSPVTSSSGDFPSGSPTPTGTGSASASAPTTPALPASDPAGSSGLHPAPADPLKTVTVHASSGLTYLVKIWAEVRDATCVDHAYGKPIIDFLTQHPCRGLQRYLGTTTVGGRAVGFAESTTSFTGTAVDPYVTSGKFRQLEEADGTGSLNDLLREGYRMPSGPSSVPSPDAFTVIGQDNGVTVWDVWYLAAPTANNDKALVQMAQDLFLQF